MEDEALQARPRISRTTSGRLGGINYNAILLEPRDCTGRTALGELASVHKCLRICDLCKELGIFICTRNIAAERERQAKTDACLVPLCPLASMVPVFWR